jgi:hypothetical protein
VCDVIWVIHGPVCAQSDCVWLTTVILHLSTHPAAVFTIQTWCTWLRYWQLLMVHHANWRGDVGLAQVRKSSYVNQKIVRWSTCHTLQAKSAGMEKVHVIAHSDSADKCWSQIDCSQHFWMEMIILRNTILDVNNEFAICSMQLLSVQSLLRCDQCQHQQSVNDC